MACLLALVIHQGPLTVPILFGFLSSRCVSQDLMYSNAAGALLVSLAFLLVGDDPPERSAA